MGCFVMSKKFFLEQMDKSIKGEFIILSNQLGNIRGASKKKMKSFEVGFTNDCFKKPESINDLLNSRLWGLIMMDKKFMTEETIKNIIESEKKYYGEKK
jgi:hypothetical protein